MSTEQSNKTAAIAAICLAAFVLGKPCVVLAKDSYANVSEMSGKLKDWIPAMAEFEVQFLAGGERAWKECFDAPIWRMRFTE